MNLHPSAVLGPRPHDLEHQALLAKRAAAFPGCEWAQLGVHWAPPGQVTWVLIVPHFSEFVGVQMLPVDLIHLPEFTRLRYFVGLDEENGVIYWTPAQERLASP